MTHPPHLANRNTAVQDGFLGYLDGILRNREDYFAGIFEGRAIGKNLAYLFIIVIGLSAFYGITMGASKGLSLQLLATAIKVPLLYLLTLLVCYPVLYVVIVIMGSKLSFLQTFALIMLAIALNSILLASCAPIVLFFTLTGADYDFLKLLHVTIFAFSGAWGMAGLWRGLQAMCEKSELYPKQAIKILRVWVLVFAFVGTQMAWSLRPFIGSPGMEFQIFRTEQTGNFYQAVWQSIARLSDVD
ncbi:MAG: actin-binding WH2 domain-containing protein [Candidatus Omnitrophica bacterium]|nr:actin-binding WH2 domain-containing protein [Candidatus Omnitrophota bacterium]